MKTIAAILLALCLSTYWANAQITSPTLPTVGTIGQGTPTNTPYAVVSKGANQQLWQCTTYETLPSGQTIPHIHQYTQIETGLHYWSNGQWLDSKEEIDILPNGTAAATNGQHQAYFPGDIYQGVIELVTPDGKQLQSRPLGVSYDDGTNTVLIAELTNSVGVVVGNNQVIYPNAFTGFKADLRYTYTKAGFEQDVILRQQPPTPESLGLNPDSARLQVMTEFFNPPPPTIQSTALAPQAGISLVDQSLSFGTMQMAPGRAFLLGQNGQDSGALVGKHWVLVQGRQLLIEEVPVDAILQGLAALPMTAMSSTTPKPTRLASYHLVLPPQRPAGNDGASVTMLAKAESPAPGFVLDYQTINSSLTNYTFRGDTTFYISGTVNLYQTNTFEANTVLKFATNGTIAIAAGSSQKVIWGGGLYRPVIFTAKDDNTIGESVSTNTPSGYYGNPMLSLGALIQTPTINGLRINYAKTAMQVSSISANIYNAQIVNCQSGLLLGGATIFIGNALFANTVTNIIIQYNTTVNAQSTTFSTSKYLVSGPASYSVCSAVFTNCILAYVTNLFLGVLTTNGNYNGYYASGYVTGIGFVAYASSYPFRSMGAGNYYLTNGSPFQNVGTTNIDPTLLSSLRQKTTCPPIVYSNLTISANTNFSPRAQRDTDIPDLGYHYDPIDYLVDLCSITNATLTVTNGTAIATYNEAGFRLQDGSQITSIGSPVSPNWFVRYSSVQEQPISLKGTNSGGITVLPSYTNTMPSGQFRFTKFACPAGGGIHLYDYAASSYSNFLVQDCEFWSGANTLGGTNSAVLTLKNNLFARSVINASGNGSLSLSNTLAWGVSSVQLNPSSANPWYAFNNDFDRCTLANSTLTNGYNAYLNCSGRLYPTNAHDVVSNASLAYQTGFLGAFYQPTNSPLIDAGNTNASLLGLYHYTTQTNQVKETNSLVDIGYHYVATGTNGIPLDSNGDGIPDYLEDANGNGLDDPGESPWDMLILQQPLSQIVEAGDTVTFTVVMGAGVNLTYQWTFNGVPINGATNSSYTIYIAQNEVQNCNYDGTYQVLVSNGANSIASAPAQLATISDDPLGPWDSDDLNLMPVVGQRQDYTFKAGMTFYIDSPITLYGNTTIEGGAVLKFDNDYSTNSSLVILGGLTCKTGPYNPALMTSVDDNSVGDSPYTSTGYPNVASNAAPYLDLTCATSNSISNLRICFANWGVTTPTFARRLDVWDCQFGACNSAIVNLTAANSTNALHNVLFVACGAGIAASTNTIAIEGEQVTADVQEFYLTGLQPSRLALTNTIIIGQIFNLPSACSHVVFNPDPTNLQFVDSGAFYLAPNSPLHQTGTASLSPRLLSELHGKTTFPPIAIAANFTLAQNIVLSPQPLRYTNGAPDLGYYYDALDYTVGMLVLDGAQLTVLPGTAIGLRNEYVPAIGNWNYWGFWLQHGAVLISHGTPNQPIIYSDVQLVQEEPAYPCYALFVPDYGPFDTAIPAPTMDLRFCNLYVSSPWNYQVWGGCEPSNLDCGPSHSGAVNLSLQDCNLKGGCITLGNNLYFCNRVTCAISWINNSFDNVTFNLDPGSPLCTDTTLQADLSLLARNNLFRGGMWFHINPILASAGDWVFENNFFDRVNFHQNTGQPLDYDFNGYWPLSAKDLAWIRFFNSWGESNASQFSPTTTSGGFTDGGHEQWLTTAPPYQAGPFGNFYLPTNTPLYSAGSDTAANLGLYHYTTRPDQVKEGNEGPSHKVNIGQHYVAAANGVPVDHDNDGIPDYVENWHGDGDTGPNRIHTADETDWQNPVTDGITDDAYNAVYDNDDLSGNGLTGAAEKFLGLNPLARDNPLVISAIPQRSTLSDAIEIPLNVGTNVDTNVAFQLVVDGTIADAEIWQTNGNWFVDWDTMVVANGPHSVSLSLAFDEDSERAFGGAQFITVTNAITLDPVTMWFTDQLNVDAQVNVDANQYQVAVYNAQTQTLLTNLTGDISNGRIQTSWNLQDGNGNRIANGPLRCDFYLTSSQSSAQAGGLGMSPSDGPSGSPSASAVYTFVEHISFSAFAVAWGNEEADAEKWGNMMLNGVVDNLNTLSDLYGDGTDYNLLPTGGSGNINDPYTSAFGWGNNQDDTQTLLGNLSSSGDFFYLGHGGPGRITPGPYHWWQVFSPPNPNWGISAKFLAIQLNNSMNNHYIGHPYRLVILNSCNGYSPAWAHAFGFAFQWGGSHYTVNDYNNFGREPQAFVAWEPDLAAPDNTWTDSIDRYRQCLWTLMDRWQSGYPLRDCMEAYTDALIDQNFGHVYDPKKYKISGCVDLDNSFR